MTQEEKELLLKDLCARLPYGVQVCYKIHLEDEPIDVTLSGLLLDYFKNKTIVEIKPYLRPMSSMTEEEKRKYIRLSVNAAICGDYQQVDYLNSIHVDYRGLIPKGLAIEAPEGMYK